IAESPDRADAIGDPVAEELAHEIALAFPAGRQDDEIRGQRLAVAQARASRGEPGDVRKLREADPAFGDEVRAADVEVVAAAARQVLELPAGAVFPEVELESLALQRIEQRLVELLRLLGEDLVGP